MQTNKKMTCFLHKSKNGEQLYNKITSLHNQSLLWICFPLHYVAEHSHYSRSMAPLKTYLADRSAAQELITLIGSGKMFDTKLPAIIWAADRGPQTFMCLLNSHLQQCFLPGLIHTHTHTYQGDHSVSLWSSGAVDLHLNNIQLCKQQVSQLGHNIQISQFSLFGL